MKQASHNSRRTCRLETAEAGYYVVFDHREEPEPRVETETLDGSMIRSYVIPVIQERPSS